MNIEKINNLEERIIEGKEIKDLLEILAMDYFDKTIKEDSLVVYNYRNFHEMYCSLLSTIILKFDALIDKLESNHKSIWEDYLESRNK